jgi:hypothetical protein
LNTTGGGSHKFYGTQVVFKRTTLTLDLFSEKLGVPIQREDEIEWYD